MARAVDSIRPWKQRGKPVRVQTPNPTRIAAITAALRLGTHRARLKLAVLRKGYRVRVQLFSVGITTSLGAHAVWENVAHRVDKTFTIDLDDAAMLLVWDGAGTALRKNDHKVGGQSPRLTFETDPHTASVIDDHVRTRYGSLPERGPATIDRGWRRLCELLGKELP